MERKVSTGLYRLRQPTRVRVIEESECEPDEQTGQLHGPVVELKTLMPDGTGRNVRMQHQTRPGDVLVYVSPTGLPTLMNQARFLELYEPIEGEG